MAREFKTIENLIKSSDNSEILNNVDGLGPKAISSLKNYFSNTKNMESIKILSKILNIKKTNKNSINSFFSNKNLVFTGTLQTLSRDEAKYLAKTNGAKILTSISKNTDFLISGNKSGSKLIKARKFGVKIINEQEFLDKVNQ